MDFKSAITAVKEAHDIADYLRMSGLNLEPNGAGKWKACCPFHTEKTPSFTVNESFQNYRCWGCGANGDLINYVVEQENMSFVEAVTRLAEDKGITIEFENSDEKGTDYASLYRMLKFAADFYMERFDALDDTHPAKRQITEGRGLTYDNSKPDGIKHGYAPEGFSVMTKQLESMGFSEELMLESGLVKKSEQGKLYDFFRNRLIFIVTDRVGKPIGFTSRALENVDKMKYLNSPEGPLFHKQRVLYNLAMARKKAGKDKRIYVVEGQFDVSAFVEAGITNVVAASGTAFTRQHAAEVKRASGEDGQIVFCLDGDAAGIKASAKIFLNNPEIHENSYVVRFPNGQDPCDYRFENGNEALADYVGKPISLVEFMILNEKTKHDLSSVLGKSRYVSEGARIVKTITNLTLRDQVTRVLSLESFTPLDEVREAVANAEPMSFDAITRQRPDHSSQSVPGEQVEGSAEQDQDNPSAKKNQFDAAKMISYIERTELFDLTARFISLGLAKKKWRATLVRSRNFIPRPFHPILDDLERLADSERVFPEQFSDPELVKYLMTREFSDFYRLMDEDMLRNQIRYLHDRLQRLVQEEKSQRATASLMELLASDKTGSVEYFKELLERHEHTIAGQDPLVAAELD